jgi:hypothetical protein
MTATVTTLNAGSGGASVLVDSLSTVDGGAAPGSSIAQMVKIGFGAASDFKTPSTATPLPTSAGSMLTTVPAAAEPANPVRAVGGDQWVCSFAGSGSSVLSTDLTTPIVGTGVTYNQTSGSLNILTGTTVNAEWLSRSTVSFKATMRLRASIVASQRIANQNLQIVLADLIGEGLAFTMVSATQVNVTKTAHGFTTQNVGQFMNLAGITTVAGVPGRYAIASIIDVNTIQFTVAAWPATGSGTLTLFGWNSVRNLFNGTTATAMAWDSQRKGWATGDTTATINTTATPGTIIECDLNGRDAFLQDSLRATNTSSNFTTRASRYENLPDEDTSLYLWVWSYNGSTAPASTTTWTLGFVAVETFANTDVYLRGIRTQGTANTLTINALIAAAQTLATVTTVNTVNTLTTITTAPALVASTAAIGDVGIQIRANATGAATVFKFTAAATANPASVKATAGRVVGWNLYNTTAAIKVFRFYNLAVAPTVGTSVPTFVVPIAPNSASNVSIPVGISFATGIAIACTGAIADLDTTVTAANDVLGEIFYA